MNLGENIRAAAVKKKISTVKLANIVGKTRQWIFDLYNGKTSPRVSDLVKIAEALDTPVEYFLLGIPDQDKADDLQKLKTDVEILKTNVDDLKQAGAYILRLIIKEADDFLQ